MVHEGRRFAAAAAAAAFAAVCAAHAPAQAQQAPRPRVTPGVLPTFETAITISVNGDELPRHPAPRIVNGRIMVPLVRIYNALGVVVQRSGGQLIASAPDKRVVLTIGSAVTTIDGIPIRMDAPALLIDGTTYVPLRYVADSLGASVTYTQRAGRVEIVSSIVGRNPGIEQRASAGGVQVIGVVSAVDLNSEPPSITVERGPDVRTVAVTSDAAVTIQDVVARTSTAAAIGDLRVGDAVSVLVRANGRVGSIVARYSSRSGKIAAVAGSTFVLDDGFIVTPDKSTSITLNSRPAEIGDLAIGDAVTVRVNPDTNEKREIIASRNVAATPQAAAGIAAIASFATSGKTALRAGDTLEITLRGTAAGRATCDLGTYLSGLPMTENMPGVYTLRYTVPAGVNFGPAPVYGHLAAGGSEAPRVQADQLVAVSTTPPQVVDLAPGVNQTINNNRPSIFATFRAPTGVEIDPASVTLAVNGIDVTGQATRTDGFVTYSPVTPLADGTVRVDVRVGDRAGNVGSRSWTFTIHSR